MGFLVIEEPRLLRAISEARPRILHFPACSLEGQVLSFLLRLSCALIQQR